MRALFSNKRSKKMYRLQWDLMAFFSFCFYNNYLVGIHRFTNNRTNTKPKEKDTQNIPKFVKRYEIINALSHALRILFAISFQTASTPLLFLWIYERMQWFDWLRKLIVHVRTVSTRKLKFKCESNFAVRFIRLLSFFVFNFNNNYININERTNEQYNNL